MLDRPAKRIGRSLKHVTLALVIGLGLTQAVAENSDALFGVDGVRPEAVREGVLGSLLSRVDRILGPHLAGDEAASVAGSRQTRPIRKPQNKSLLRPSIPSGAKTGCRKGAAFASNARETSARG